MTSFCYRISDPAHSQFTMGCKKCKSKNKKFTYCKRCNRTYCEDCYCSHTYQCFNDSLSIEEKEQKEKRVAKTTNSNNEKCCNCGNRRKHLRKCVNCEGKVCDFCFMYPFFSCRLKNIENIANGVL